MSAIPARLQHIEKRLHARREARRSVQPDRRLAQDAVAFARERLHFVPDPWQSKVLTWTGTHMLMNCARQSGKSTVAAILSLHRAIYVPRSLILMVSPSLRQSAELFKRTKDFVEMLPVRPALTEDNRLSLQMTNKSRIVSLPATEARIRGFSGASLIIEDESARVPDDLYLSVRPMLAVSNGRHILMSTPWGKRGHFYETWENGGPSWERIKIIASECPRISAEFLAQEKRDMPRAWFDSEYNCLFGNTVDSVFLQADIDAAMSVDVRPLFPTEVLH